ncbi:MAG: glycosyltransferase family 2 protein [Actinomycetes bacterium]
MPSGVTHAVGDVAIPAPRPPLELKEQHREAPQAEPAPGGGRYLPVAAKFWISTTAAVTWMAFSVWLSLPWLEQLAQLTGLAFAVAVIALIAWAPGWLVAFLAVSLLLDRQPPLPARTPTPPVTIIVAAYNEAAGIAGTLACIARQDYAGPVRVILADNASTDGTADIARRAAADTGMTLSVVREERRGKSHALNTALAHVGSELVVTLDADTLLHPLALRQLVARLHAAPSDVGAVAGSVLVRNSRASFWARLQEWDYFLGIASVKRMQGLYQGTLVAQGAFSLYRTVAVRSAGGWPDAIGEDIVLTWRMLSNERRVYFEPLAVAFTDVPTGFRHFARQRARWARGMIEGLRAVPPWRQPYPMTKVVTSTNLLIPLLDLAYTLVWLPGLVLALFGHYWIVGPYTAFVLPLTLLVNWLLYRYQHRAVFGRLNLRIRKNVTGFVAYVLLFQMIMSPVALMGYTQELLGLRRRWK